MEKVQLLKGNEALAEAAVRAGCRYYFGYPITPQNEIPAYMSKRLPEVGGVFIQAESETASINMVYGACSCGARAMTSSSSPGISLMQEGLSYLAGADLPAVVINVMRGGPGLGNISPSQADYLQSVKGGGHGDYNLIVLAPYSVQEIVDLTIKCFDLAFKYRNPVMLIADGMLGQMSEPVVLPKMIDVKDDLDWVVGNGNHAIIHSLYLNPEDMLEIHNAKLQKKYEAIKNECIEFEKYLCDDATSIFVSYGTPARVCKAAIDELREKGIKVGLFRPISLWPFPEKELNELASQVANHSGKVIVVEMAKNQLEQDVKLAVNGKCEIVALNKLGGAIFNETEIIDFVLKDRK
ncbi:MAG: 3-methyl-2-oxobutanoate dehydrogenase subunit VorB [Spirochaetes bacterium GWD1_27_9]|nr:MAG: 3-methyl-2-oxobutanoate dehydrogenase subunit VorB [Spirochaetes bacterium GWB1_27_13]OHD20116.1 MAG: 3-methyl-2-oxobutanoate dehydrogenase subunit VorB [Spirochaetes bacterium GWC1_27_15]OHD28842.1 MAG: 3-methyl-2-oxobutanoate dehydrogenase subunit VorB [Spirochaetes bacterium GWD1_27_9]